MPYASRDRQLQYMRAYMERKRTIKRIARLLVRRDQIEQQRESEPLLTILDPEGEHIKRIDGWIQECMAQVKECDGLLKTS